ncbi:MAG TPA: hypothetical protein VK982_02320 [Bacteroidales bacterium]|nr:hypothetical protein [Bacteroidales bacterium]
MRKTFLLALIILFVLASYHQSSAQLNKLGGGLTLAMGNELDYEAGYTNNSLGLNLRANWSLGKKLDLVPDLTMYLPKKHQFPSDGGESITTVYVLNVNFHYILNYRTRNNFYVYLLGGVHAGGWHIKDNHSSVIAGGKTYDFNTMRLVPGANLGGGIQFKVGYKTEFFTEVKYIISETHQLAFTPGILFHL